MLRKNRSSDRIDAPYNRFTTAVGIAAPDLIMPSLRSHN